MSQTIEVPAESRWQHLRGDASIAAFALASSITSIANGFAVDDRSIIEQNDRVHSLANVVRLFVEGYWPTRAQAGLYRPITTLAFTLQWVLGGGSPALFHVVSILLYVASAWLVYRLAQRLTTPLGAWIAAAVFAVHPVHVEAVGNIVGQSELISTIAVLAASLLYVRELQRSFAGAAAFSARAVLQILILYTVGALSKENAILLPALLVLLHIHLRRMNEPADANSRRSVWGAEFTGVRLTYLAMTAIALAIVWVRDAVLVDTTPAPNTALEGLSFSGRLATFFSVVPQWLRLFVWPAHLIPVYSPPYVHVARDFDAAAVPGFVIVLICIVIAIVAGRRSSTHAVTLGIEWTAVSLFPVSNIVVATGIILAERTLFLPSVGFALAVGAAADLIWSRTQDASWRPLLKLAGGAVLAIGLVRSAVHQRVWSDDGHLITAAIQTAPDSYMLDAMYADYALRTGNPAGAEQWLKRAIKLYPNDPSLHISLGELYVQANRYDVALLSFSVAMGLDRENADARAGMILCLDHLGRYKEARTLARMGVALGGEEATGFRRLLFLTDSLSGVATKK